MLGVGTIGGVVARIDKALGMEVIAWSQNLTAERATEAGAALVAKEELFRQADILTIHVVLSSRTRGLVSAKKLALMKPTARLVNTSRGPIVVEADLIAVLRKGKIAAAALDVFDQEPLPGDHPFRSVSNLLATPHIGYVSHDICAVLPGYGRQYQAMARSPGPALIPLVDRSRHLSAVPSTSRVEGGDRLRCLDVLLRKDETHLAQSNKDPIVMPEATAFIIETRGPQMFPKLDASEIDRVRRFGELRRFKQGDALAKVGTIAPGLTVILAGSVAITRRDASGERAPITTYERGSFLGELAQLAGRPAFIDAHASEPVEALVIPPERLRALLKQNSASASCGPSFCGAWVWFS